jgi:hypothetical protein
MCSRSSPVEFRSPGGVIQPRGDAAEGQHARADRASNRYTAASISQCAACRRLGWNLRSKLSYGALLTSYLKTMNQCLRRQWTPRLEKAPHSEATHSKVGVTHSLSGRSSGVSMLLPPFSKMI